jgi:hypothetical protein
VREKTILVFEVSDLLSFGKEREKTCNEKCKSFKKRYKPKVNLYQQRCNLLLST